EEGLHDESPSTLNTRTPRVLMTGGPSRHVYRPAPRFDHRPMPKQTVSNARTMDGTALAAVETSDGHEQSCAALTQHGVGRAGSTRAEAGIPPVWRMSFQAAGAPRAYHRCRCRRICVRRWGTTMARHVGGMPPKYGRP